MSNRIFQAVWDFGPETRTEMLVLMALADCADAESGECFPSIEHISRAARASRRTVVLTLKALEADGWIKIDVRTRANGSQTSNLYTINTQKLGLAPLPVRPPKGGVRKPHGGDAKPARGGVQPLHPTSRAETAPPEQTIINKGRTALIVDLSKITAYQRSALAGGRSVLIAGFLYQPGSPETENLRQAVCV